jgi:predicted MFS family arabinose efflux permease
MCVYQRGRPGARSCYAAFSAMTTPTSERAIVFLIGAVQFVNILDFLMVMPLGPDFAVALHIPLSRLGLVGGSYAAAAALSGLLGALFLDRFDRRTALGATLFGLVVSTALGGLSRGLYSLMAARLLAGLFGGPATSLAYSIIADEVPAERRGRALGAVLGAFSVASILGVPAGLEMARHGGWRVPFFSVAALGAAIGALAIVLLPPMRRHLNGFGEKRQRLSAVVFRPLVLSSYTMTAVVMMSGFLLIPNLSTFLQRNLGYPRERLGLLYLFGGLVSFLSMRVAGRGVDYFGSFPVGSAGVAVLLAVIASGLYRALLPVPVLFIAFMLAMALRNVAYNTLTSKVPEPNVRARFLSIQSAVQHASSSTGAFLSTRILIELPHGRLGQMPTLAALSMALTSLVPLLLWETERRLRLQNQAQRVATATE